MAMAASVGVTSAMSGGMPPREHRSPKVLVLSGTGKKRHAVVAAEVRRRRVVSATCMAGTGSFTRRCALLAAPLGLLQLSTPQVARGAEGTKHFSSGGVSFDYPASWLMAYDRLEKVDVGSLVFVGDFKEVDTISIARAELPEDLAGLADGALGAKEASEVLLKEPLSSSSTMGLRILDASSSRPTGAPGPVYRTEYVLNVCRGLVQEEAGGTLRCVTATGTELQTVERHHINVSVVKGGKLYTFSASALEARWGLVGGKLLDAASSFQLAA
mmetsp:Transcript_17201/g.43246  ORF Transcript_17201/g.43246 Transcript_17201/m.43246 type:complete len:272 (-) Transcript_17201:157-972(-)